MLHFLAAPCSQEAGHLWQEQEEEEEEEEVIIWLLALPTRIV
jgi:hypothetical protein